MLLKIKGDIWADNPMLGRHAIFTDPGKFQKKELGELLVFVWHFVDSAHSPLRDEADIKNRLARSVEMTGFKSKRVESACLSFFESDGKVTDWVASVMSAYCSLVNPTKYEDWLSSKINYHRMSKLLMGPLPTDEEKREMAAKRRLEIDRDKGEAAKRLLEKELALFNSEELAEKISEQAMKDALAGWAERFAEDLPDGVAI